MAISLTKTKLPRKRKKLFIKKLGRIQYYKCIKTSQILGESAGKFWKTYEYRFDIFEGCVLPKPKSYW